MIYFTSFEQLIPQQVDRLSLKPYNKDGIIPLFGLKTNDLSYAVYEQICRYDRRNGIPKSGTYEEKKEVVKWILEHTALVGTLAASKAHDNSHVYDLGGAIGIASITYALVFNGTITLVDIDKEETQHAREVARMMGVDGLVEVINARAEDILEQRGIGSQDITIFSEPDGTLRYYWKELISKYNSTLILNQYLELKDHLFRRPLARALENVLISKYAEEHMTRYDYNVQVIRSKFSSCQLVFLCKKLKKRHK